MAAKKKIDTPKTRTKAVKAVSKTKKIAEPKSNVKVVKKQGLKKTGKNLESYFSTKKAKSGETAKEKAAEIRKANVASRAAGKTPVIKIRGGAGMGGMFNTKNR